MHLKLLNKFRRNTKISKSKCSPSIINEEIEEKRGIFSRIESELKFNHSGYHTRSDMIRNNRVSIDFLYKFKKEAILKKDLRSINLLCQFKIMNLDEFKEFFLNNDFYDSAMTVLVYNPFIIQDFESFKKIWMNKAVRDRVFAHFKKIDNLIHDENTNNIDSQVLIMNPNNEISDFIHKEVRENKVSNQEKEIYASLKCIANPDVLDLLKNESYRPIINKIALNPKAYLKTHRYLIKKYNSPRIRESIASITTDSKLLKLIYK